MKKLKKRIPLKYIYVLSAIIAILLSVGLYYTYAMFTANVNSGNVVNMDTALNYTFDVSGTQNFHVGKNSIASFNFIVNNSSNGSIYYEIYYSTNNDLTDVIIGEVVEDKTVTTIAPNTSGANESDSHMMKNIEWGAVAYLKQSIYGLGITDVEESNSNYTGGGTGNAYKNNGGRSTTGNITGIYDMKEMIVEYMMGNYNKTAGSSGLTISTVPTEHIDIYSGYSVSASHLGDATGETAGWYSNYKFFVDPNNPWFARAGRCSIGNNAGVFGFCTNTGEAGYSFRTVLATE